MRLTGKVAIVTGASRGIGRGLALALAREGADVVVNSVDDKEAEHVVHQIKALGREALAIKTDVSKASEVEEMVAITMDKFNQIDILVNNAGISVFTPFFEVTEEVWDRTIEVNLKGAFLCSQAAAREMVKRKWGRIINITSCGAKLAFNHMPHYCASKGGLTSLTMQMAVELGRYNITVNAVGPGLIQTEANARILADRSVYEFYVGRIPLGRAGEPKDVAGAVVFLASDDADYITGQSFYVDGGWATHAPEPLDEPPERKN
jgi:NAD(P)-dependent dehydrogenase (short-subunit alcohol dehydrogenase family)